MPTAPLPFIIFLQYHVLTAHIKGKLHLNQILHILLQNHAAKFIITHQEKFPPDEIIDENIFAIELNFNIFILIDFTSQCKILA